MLVREIMSAPVVTVGPATTVRAALARLVEGGYTALPVIEAGADGDVLVGIVTEADVLRGRVRHDAHSRELHGEVEKGPPPGVVGEVMTTDVVAFDPWTDVAEAAGTMGERGIRSAPVVEVGKGLVGMITRRDIARTYVRPDPDISADVDAALTWWAGPGRWRVAVEDGVVSLTDLYGELAERHGAKVAASTVRGVMDVRVVDPR